MLLILPVVVLLISSLAILVLQFTRRGLGYAWLLAVLSSLAVWGLILWYHWRSAAPVLVVGWQPINQAVGEVRFAFDSISWPYAFGLAGLTVAAILTASARLQARSNPYAWAAMLALAAVGILGSLAATPLALLITWTAIDLAELAVMLFSVSDGRLNQQAVVAFSARVLGSLMVVFAMLYSRANGVTLTLENLTPGTGFFLLLGAGLRLGVLPLHLPYPQEILARRGLGTMLRMVMAVTSLSLLGRISLLSLSNRLAGWLTAFIIFALLYTAVMWLTARSEIRGRPYWLIAFSGLAVVCVLNDQPQASVIWGSAALLSGGLIFLYSIRSKALLGLPVLGALGLSGLPFTPVSGGWEGLFRYPFNLLNLVVILVLALLVVGYLRHALAAADAPSDADRWVLLVYPLGLSWLVLTQWLIHVFGRPWPPQFGNLWASLATLLLVLVGIFLIVRGQMTSLTARMGWLAAILARVRRPLESFFRLEWVYRLLWVVYRIAQWLVKFLTGLLEGEGGILWVLLLLALLISVIQTGGGS